MRFQGCTLCARQDEAVLRAGLERFEQESGRKTQWEWFERQEDLLYRLRHDSCDAVLVLLPGALGMEAAMRVREFAPRTPLVWISNDGEFAQQAYRMQVRMFLQAPVSEMEVAHALVRCTEKEKFSVLCPRTADGQKTGGNG